MRGIDICRSFYEQCGAPLLKREVPDVVARAAVGLAGEGSDCFGFDDLISRDHDWGPAFCLWLPATELDRNADRLEAALAGLPAVFEGIAVRMRPQLRQGRVGPLSIEDFYARFTNLTRPPASWKEWRLIPENFLAVATNGEIFHDPSGRFTAHREALLAFYPEDVRRKKIAARLAGLAQSGQYNLPRVLRRGETVAALLTAAEFSRQALSLTFLLNRRYMPFYKWAFRAAADLPLLGEDARTALDGLARLRWDDISPQAAADAVETLCVRFASTLRAEGLSDVGGDWLLTHAEAVQRTIVTPELRAMPLMME